jgi:hypothetical protein
VRARSVSCVSVDVRVCVWLVFLSPSLSVCAGRGRCTAAVTTETMAAAQTAQLLFAMGDHVAAVVRDACGAAAVVVRGPLTLRQLSDVAGMALGGWQPGCVRSRR